MKYFALSLLTFSIMSFADQAPFELKPQGTITAHSEESKFAPNCKAKRDYPVIEKLANADVQKALNEKWAKILTVGKKLQANDCPGADSKESYEYHNSYSVGGQRGDYLGISFSIFFPGGSGRLATDCRIIDLRSGKEINLKARLKPGGVKYIQQIMAKTPDFGFNEIYNPQGLTPATKNEKFSPFCLEADGIQVMKTPSEKFVSPITLTPADLEQVFTKDAAIDALKAK